MKCPICNAENPPDAGSCQACGFGLSLSRVEWPELPTIDVLQPDAGPPWPDTPGVEMPSLAPAPTIDLSPPTFATGEQEPAPGSEPEEPVPPEPGGPPAGGPTDDELAKEHMSRGFEAIRSGMPDQARWEFEQARDLADDEEIAAVARAHLADLTAAPSSPVPLPTPPPAPRPARRPTPQVTPLSLDDLVPPAVTAQIKATDWAFTLKTGAIAGGITALITGCGAATCLGALFAPLAGLVTGLVIANQKKKTGQRLDAFRAMLAGGIAGLGGWLGQIIGYPIIMATTERSSTSMAWPVLTCLVGAAYVPFSSALGALGWKIIESK